MAVRTAGLGETYSPHAGLLHDVLLFGPKAQTLRPGAADEMAGLVEGRTVYEQFPVDEPMSTSPRDSGTVMPIYGPDGTIVPAFEVSDADAEIPVPFTQEEFSRHNNAVHEQIGKLLDQRDIGEISDEEYDAAIQQVLEADDAFFQNSPKTVGDLIRGTDLQYILDAYPEIGDVGLDYSSANAVPGANGAYYPNENMLWLDPWHALEGGEDVLLHELQHVIDRIEGRPLRESYMGPRRTGQAKDKLAQFYRQGRIPFGDYGSASWYLQSPEQNLYYRAPTEINAFGTQARRELSPEGLAVVPYQLPLPGDRRQFPAVLEQDYLPPDDMARQALDELGLDPPEPGGLSSLFGFGD